MPFLLRSVSLSLAWISSCPLPGTPLIWIPGLHSPRSGCAQIRLPHTALLGLSSAVGQEALLPKALSGASKRLCVDVPASALSAWSPARGLYDLMTPLTCRAPPPRGGQPAPGSGDTPGSLLPLALPPVRLPVWDPDWVPVTHAIPADSPRCCSCPPSGPSLPSSSSRSVGVSSWRLGPVDVSAGTVRRGFICVRVRPAQCSVTTPRGTSKAGPPVPYSALGTEGAGPKAGTLQPSRPESNSGGTCAPGSLSGAVTALQSRGAGSKMLWPEPHLCGDLPSPSCVTDRVDVAQSCTLQTLKFKTFPNQNEEEQLACVGLYSA